MTNPQTPGIPGVNAMTDTLALVKNMWGSMGVPGMAVPTLSVEELDKKISDLKAVETWLNINMSMLRGTIQTMEVQRTTLASLKSFSSSMNAAIKTAAEPAAKTRPAAPGAPDSNTGAKQEELPDAADLFNAQMQNAAAWWNVLQEQFGQAVSSAVAGEADGKDAQDKGATPDAASPAADQAGDKEKSAPRKRSAPKSS